VTGYAATSSARKSLSPVTTDETHRESITTTEAAYCIHVGGTVDGESVRDPVGYGNYGQCWENNLWTRLENVGEELVVNPWIEVGHSHWQSLEQILESILAPDMSDADKARAIWEFARRHRYHSTTADDEVKDTVKMLNVYGYTLCWDEAFTLSNLWQAAGLKIRRGLPHGHCTTEVFYDGAWHLLDSDEHLLVLGRDNKTIVGETEISRDHDLMKRSHAYGLLSPENRSRSESAASLFCYAGERSGTRARIGDHRMDLTLRPGESLTWRWDERGRYHGYGDAPPRFCNGSLMWSPPLDSTFERWTESSTSAQSNGAGLSADALSWLLRTPYVMVGGQLEADLGQSPVRVELSRHGEGWVELGNGLAGDVILDLDPYFAHDSAPCYSVRLRLTGSGVTVNDLHIELTLQMAPLSLPALRLGDNRVIYADGSPGRRVEITHAWREREDLQAPAAPIPEGFGTASVTVRGTKPTLRWSDTCGESGDYHLRLSTDPALRWVLSPVFEKLLSRTPAKGQAQWTVPEEGLLNPETSYYWQVRARSADDVWGPWSDTASFTCRAPGVPLHVHLDMDWQTRRGTLHWRANPEGETPVRFEIYGSDERGFSISRQEYTIVAGESEENGVRVMTANLLSETQQTSAVVVDRGLNTGNRAFYRVVAIDAEGVRSGPSDYAEATRPFLTTELPARITAGETTVITLATIQSIGDLRAESVGPHRYRQALRDGDDVLFLLDEGPDFVELALDGQLTLRPEPRHASTHTITVRVKNGQGGVDVVGFDLLVMP
jgi:hypothetical protein